MQTIQMLRHLTQVDGVAGGEDRALAVAQEICENLGECSRTIQKSLVCQVMPPQEGRPHLLLDAHIDADVEHLDLFTFDAGCLVDDRLGLVAEKDLQIFQTVLVAAGVIDSFRINADGFLEAAAAAIAWSDYL